MKKVLIIFVIALFTASIWAQSPEKMSYQAVVRDASNNLVTNTQVGMVINIYQGSISGVLVYTETQTPTTNNNGLLTIKIGGQIGFDTINWANGPYFLETNIDINGGTNYTITGISQLLSVPYAFHAKTAESITGEINETDPVYLSSQAANITATDIINLNNLSGINTGDQDISGIMINRQAIQDTASQIRADIPDVSGFITIETDPVYSAWDKSYNDLTNKPNIADTVTLILDTTTQFVRAELDADPSNEIQTISRTGLTVTLSNGGGSFQDSVNTQNLSSVLTQGTDAGNKKITNLADPTNAQDAVTKSYVDILKQQIIYIQQQLLEIQNMYLTSDTTGIMKDIDGNEYKTIKIGNQWWMAEDLRVTHYPNGDSIPYITDDFTWGQLGDNSNDDACSFYNNNSNTDYGALYTYAAAIADNWQKDNDTLNSEGGQGVCPDGWHLPTDDEWKTLEMYIGMTQESADSTGWRGIVCGKLKEIGFTHWNSPNAGATDDYGFTALPGGYRYYLDGQFYDIGVYGKWWNSTENGTNGAYCRNLVNDKSKAFRHLEYKSSGFSVRCVRN